MLRPSGKDADFRQALEQDLAAWNPAWEKEISWSLTADIDRLLEPIQALYSATRGRPAFDPAQLLRAIGLLTVRETASLVDGFKEIRQIPWLARLCGWIRPEDLPAIGTVYAFLRRLYPEKTRRVGAWRLPSGRRRLHLKTGQKMPPRHPGAVARVARRVAREAQRPSRLPSPSDCWDELLARTTVESVERQILPPTWHIAPDGTPIESGASSFSKKTCQCPGTSCQCRRWFSDPVALPGWDSHRHRYFLGYMPLAMAVVNAVPGDTSHPLIVSLNLHPGNRNDAVAYPHLLVKTQALYAERSVPITMTHGIGDAAFDADPLWTFTRDRQVIPVFAPHSLVTPARMSAAAEAAGIQLVGEQHQPVCADGQVLIPLGTRREGVTVDACPLRQRKTATCTTPCAKCGKTVTFNDHGSRYAQSGVSYGSPAWKSLYAERTGVERAFSLWTQDGIKRAHHRRPYLWTARLAMGAIVAHHQAWARHTEAA